MYLQYKSSFIFFLVLAFAISLGATAQTEPGTFTAKKGIYLEVGGSSGIYAINYSKIFHQRGILKLNASAGFSMLPHRLDSKTTWLPVVPLEISALVGKSNHHLEIGMGITPYLTRSLAFDSETSDTIDKVVFGSVMPLRVGYRYQKPEGGFFFRIGYTPFFNVPVRDGKNWSFNPYMAGVSFGKSFLIV